MVCSASLYGSNYIFLRLLIRFLPGDIVVFLDELCRIMLYVFLYGSKKLCLCLVCSKARYPLKLGDLLLMKGPDLFCPFAQGTVSLVQLLFLAVEL